MCYFLAFVNQKSLAGNNQPVFIIFLSTHHYSVLRFVQDLGLNFILRASQKGFKLTFLPLYDLQNEGANDRLLKVLKNVEK